MSKILKTALVGAVAASAAVLPLSGTAFASNAPDPSADYPGGAVVASDGGNAAVVRVAYSCTSDENHLFVAVKQGPDVSPENPSSEDQTLTAFLSTNWSPDSGPNALSCDGRRHVQRIVVMPQAPGQLTDGPALVQICLYENAGSGYAGSYTMQRVVVSHAPAH